MINNDFRHIEPEEDEVIEIPGKYRHVFYGYYNIEFARMASPANRNDDMSGLLTVDGGATTKTTITKELLNMSNVKPKVVTIQLAMAGATMKSTHVGIKTYYVYDRTGTFRPIPTKAYYVKELNQGLLEGSALTNADYRVVLDKWDAIAGMCVTSSLR